MAGCWSVEIFVCRLVCLLHCPFVCFHPQLTVQQQSSDFTHTERETLDWE